MIKLGVKDTRGQFNISYEQENKYEVIMAGNIMVAQGWKCSKCGLIRAFDRPTCNCH